MNTSQHERYLRRAIELAKNNPAFPFGCVIVEETTGAIVAEGWNRSGLNPHWHGEIDALNQLARVRSPGDWQNLILYTTGEPCAMCQSAILWSGIGTVVFGTSIRTLQRLGWKQIDILSEEVVRRTPFANCVLIGGILESECDALFVAPPQ